MEIWGDGVIVGTCKTPCTLEVFSGLHVTSISWQHNHYLGLVTALSEVSPLGAGLGLLLWNLRQDPMSGPTAVLHPRFPHYMVIIGTFWGRQLSSTQKKSCWLIPSACGQCRCLWQHQAALHPVPLWSERQVCLGRCDFWSSCPARDGKLLKLLLSFTPRCHLGCWLQTPACAPLLGGHPSSNSFFFPYKIISLTSKTFFSPLSILTR